MARPRLDAPRAFSRFVCSVYEIVAAAALAISSFTRSAIGLFPIFI